MNAARYLNVDCILRSKHNLSELLSFLKDDVFLLWNEPSSGGSFVGFETNIVNTSGPEEDITEFLRLFDLHSSVEVLGECESKVFDIGFESGDSGEAVDIIICHDVVNKISELGFSINIRVYPVPPIQE